MNYPSQFFNSRSFDFDNTPSIFGRNFTRDFFSDERDNALFRSHNNQSPLERLFARSTERPIMISPRPNYTSKQSIPTFQINNRILLNNLDDREDFFLHYKPELQPKPRIRPEFNEQNYTPSFRDNIDSMTYEFSKPQTARRLQEVSNNFSNPQTTSQRNQWEQNGTSRMRNNNNSSTIRELPRPQTARRLQEVSNNNFSNPQTTSQQYQWEDPFFSRSVDNEYPNNMPRERYYNSYHQSEENENKENEEKREKQERREYEENIFEEDFIDDSQDNSIGPEDCKRLQERLQIYGMKEKTNIKGDGNCQFAAFSDQVYGNIEHSSEIRYRCVQWLRSNKDFTLSNGARLEDFLQTEFFPNWESYCDYMESNSTWGDNLTLVALAEVYQTMIVIISSIKIVDNQSPCTVITPSNWDKKRIAYLSHLHEIHYSSICPDNDV